MHTFINTYLPKYIIHTHILTYIHTYSTNINTCIYIPEFVLMIIMKMLRKKCVVAVVVQTWLFLAEKVHTNNYLKTI